MKLGDICRKAHLGEPSKEPFLKQQPLAAEDGMKLGDLCTEGRLGKPSEEPFLKHQPLATKKARRQTCQLFMGNLGDQCKQELGGPQMQTTVEGT